MTDDDAFSIAARIAAARIAYSSRTPMPMNPRRPVRWRFGAKPRASSNWLKRFWLPAASPAVRH